MAKLNQEERRYALARIDEIFRARDAQLTKKHTRLRKALTDTEARRQILDGYATLRRSGWTLSTPIGECYSFDKGREEELDHEAYSKDKAKLRKEKAKVGDAIVLGDAEEAKRLLAAFEKTV